MAASGKLLGDMLKRDQNNFDVLRLIAALAVIIGHAYAIAPQPPLEDWVQSMFHFDFSGSLAVKFFFFLSGLLVTNSIIMKPNPYHFLIKRGMRVFPGLLVCLLVAVFIIGPLYTKLPLAAYFSNHETWTYISKNFLMELQWKLPGVFTESKFGLNGSLWTLPYEVLCYIFLAMIYGLGLLRNKLVSNAFYLAMVLLPFLAPNCLPGLLVNNEGARPLISCFAFGALFANNKDRIDISGSKVVLLWLLAYMLNDSAAFQYVFYIALFYFVLYIASRNWMIKYARIPFDASYGVYVYGFMIQQCVHGSFPNVGVHGNQIISMSIALALGLLSWFIVEKPCITLGNRLIGLDPSRIGASLKKRFPQNQ